MRYQPMLDYDIYEFVGDECRKFIVPFDVGTDDWLKAIWHVELHVDANADYVRIYNATGTGPRLARHLVVEFDREQLCDRSSPRFMHESVLRRRILEAIENYETGGAA